MANERRLIDIDELKRILERRLSNGAIIAWLSRIIDTCPTVDAIIPVRCRDCKHYVMWADGRAMNHCDYHDRLAYDDDFCSYGEKSGTQPQREEA